LEDAGSATILSFATEGSRGIGSTALITIVMILASASVSATASVSIAAGDGDGQGGGIRVPPTTKIKRTISSVLTR
jgi:hypothetical protein